MKVYEKYAALVISTRTEGAAYELIVSFFNNLKKTVNRQPSSLTVRMSHSQSGDINLPSVIIESASSIKDFFIKDFSFPHITATRNNAFLLWVLRAPRRYWASMWQWFRLYWSERRYSEMVGLIFLYIPLEAFNFFFWVIMTALSVIGPLRKINSFIAVLYIYSLIAVPLILVWKEALAFLLNGIISITNQLIELAANGILTFDLLFPVLTGVILALAIFIGKLFLDAARWILRDLSRIPDKNRTIDFSYLLDPIYSTQVMSHLEHELTYFNNDSDVKHIFVIADGIGAFLAYEVLSIACRGKISKSVSLLTSNINFAGFSVSPRRMILLLVDSTDWNRFSQPTPENLYWYHFVNWPVNEFTIRFTNNARHSAVPLMVKSKDSPWKYNTEVAMINRIAETMMIF